MEDNKNMEFLQKRLGIAQSIAASLNSGGEAEADEVKDMMVRYGELCEELSQMAPNEPEFSEQAQKYLAAEHYFNPAALPIILAELARDIAALYKKAMQMFFENLMPVEKQNEEEQMAEPTETYSFDSNLVGYKEMGSSDNGRRAEEPRGYAASRFKDNIKLVKASESAYDRYSREVAARAMAKQAPALEEQSIMSAWG